MKIYIESTIVSYVAARPSRDLIRAARQELTREWWEERSGEHELYASQVVVRESAAGDEQIAPRRLALLEGLPLLDLTDEAVDLGEGLVRDGPLPPVAADDALHISLATVHGMDVLLTWNCTHLANAKLLSRVQDFLADRGYRAPVICTPDELMGE